MFTFPPSYLNFLGKCEFPRNEDANQIKMILRQFWGKPHNIFNLKTLHLPSIGPSLVISKALPRCIDTNTIYGEAAFGHAFIFDRWTDTYRSAMGRPI